MGVRPGDPGMQPVGQMCDIREGTFNPHWKIYVWQALWRKLELGTGIWKPAIGM